MAYLRNNDDGQRKGGGYGGQVKMQGFTCQTATPLDFDAVIAAVAAAYPGTRIVQHDWHADRYRQESEVAKRGGLQIPTQPMISLQRVWDKKGLQRAFEVPICDDLMLYARLDKTGGYFISRTTGIAEADVARLGGILTSFGLEITPY